MFSLTINTQQTAEGFRVEFICAATPENTRYGPQVFCYLHDSIPNTINPDDTVNGKCIGLVLPAQYHSLPTAPAFQAPEPQLKFRRDRATFFVGNAVDLAELKEEVSFSISFLVRHLESLSLQADEQEVLLFPS